MSEDYNKFTSESRLSYSSIQMSKQNPFSCDKSLVNPMLYASRIAYSLFHSSSMISERASLGLL